MNGYRKSPVIVKGIFLLILPQTYFEDIPYTYWQKVKNYPFAGYDFIIGRDGHLYFIEANAIPGGLSVITHAYRLLKWHLPPRYRKLGSYLEKIVEMFAKMSIIHHVLNSGNMPRYAIITVPKDRKDLLNPEREYINYMLRAMGVKSWLVNLADCYVKDGKIIAKINGEGDISPDLIIRRSSGLPKGLRQTVINPTEIGVITGNKQKTYDTIINAPNNRILNKIVRIPKTYYAKSPDDIIKYSREILDMGKPVIVKPINGKGGEDIIIIKNKEDITYKIRHAKIRRKYLVQEIVEPVPFPAHDGYVYAFDVRVYAFLGYLLAVQIRRAPFPLNVHGSINLTEKNIVSNISAGGTLGLVLLDPDFDGMIKYVNTPSKVLPLPHRRILIDGKVLVFGERLIRMLTMAVRELTIALSNAVEGA